MFSTSRGSNYWNGGWQTFAICPEIGWRVDECPPPAKVKGT